MNAFLWIVLDGLATNETRELAIAKELGAVEGEFGFKANLDYWLKAGAEAGMQKLHQLGRPIFVDIKMWNGRRTMASTTRLYGNLGAACINAYIQAGDELLPAIKAAGEFNMRMLGLTVLSHYDGVWCRRHFQQPLNETVVGFVDDAVSLGCHGVILPGAQLPVVEHKKVYKVATGIRPEEYKDTRHANEVTPNFASRHADAVVCGSPIMKSDDPSVALERILSQLR